MTRIEDFIFATSVRNFGFLVGELVTLVEKFVIGIVSVDGRSSQWRKRKVLSRVALDLPIVFKVGSRRLLLLTTDVDALIAVQTMRRPFSIL